MTSTVTTVTAQSNTLFTGLTDALAIDTTLPPVGNVDLDFDVGNIVLDDLSGLDVPTQLTLGELTTGAIDGTGVFDVVMRAVSAHLQEQAQKNRITGADYARTYLGALESTLAQSVNFLLGRDRATWEAISLRQNALAAAVSVARAKADLVTAKYTAIAQKLTAARVQVEAYTARAEYATSKLGLSVSYQGILQSEAQTGLINENYDAARAETKDTLRDNVTPIGGMKSIQKQTAEKQMELVTAQSLLTNEQYEAARAQTKNTLSDGTAMGGLVAVEKLTAEAQRQLVTEQVDAARAQTKATTNQGQEIVGLVGAQIKLAEFQGKLTQENYETARAQTRDTLSTGETISGIMGVEKQLKSSQRTLLIEQTDAQRAQTKLTLTDGQPVSGILATQRNLLEEQIVSFKRDAMHKAVKMMADTWVTRKSLDDGVLVPVALDNSALNTAVVKYQQELELTA